MNFAEVIKRERRKRNYTQQELADALHVSASTVGMWEQDSRVPKLEKLEEIADFFNINLDELRGQDSMDIRKGIRIPVLGSVRAGDPAGSHRRYRGLRRNPGSHGEKRRIFRFTCERGFHEPRFC